MKKMTVKATYKKKLFLFLNNIIFSVYMVLVTILVSVIVNVDCLYLISAFHTVDYKMETAQKLFYFCTISQIFSLQQSPKKNKINGVEKIKNKKYR